MKKLILPFIVMGACFAATVAMSDVQYHKIQIVNQTPYTGISVTNSALKPSDQNAGGFVNPGPIDQGDENAQVVHVNSDAQGHVYGTLTIFAPSLNMATPDGKRDSAVIRFHGTQVSVGAQSGLRVKLSGSLQDGTLKVVVHGV